MTFSLAILAALTGLVLLAWCGDRLVDGAVALAHTFKVSQLFIGIAVVGMGTSLPEMMSSLAASRAESPALLLGNVLGSNIANVGLILGIGLLVASTGKKFRRERPDFFLMLAGYVLFALFLFTGGAIDRLEGGLLMMALVVALSVSLFFARKHHLEDVSLDEFHPHPPKRMWVALLLVGGGLLGLFAGAELLVRGAIFIARDMGISERVIGLTLVAIGTSLPELAATLAAARKGGMPLIVGNVIGSNLFNILGAVGIGAVLLPLPAGGIWLDALICGLFGLAIGGLFLLRPKSLHLAGGVLLAAYAGYLSFVGAS